MTSVGPPPPEGSWQLPAISRTEQGSAMTSQVSSRMKPAATRWYALSPEDVAGRLGVDAVGRGRALRSEGRRAAPAEWAQRAPRREDGSGMAPFRGSVPQLL